MAAPTSTRPEEREFVVDSGGPMHMMSKKEISSEEMDTVKRSRTPTVVLTANGEVHTHEKAQVFVHDLNLFVTVQLLEETPLRRPRIPQCVGQRSKATTDQRREEYYLQDGAVRLLHRQSQDSLRREAGLSSRELVRPASSSSSSSV